LKRAHQSAGARPASTDPAATAALLLAAAQRGDEQALLGILNGILLKSQAKADTAPALLTEPDAARRLGISPRSLWSLANDGHIAFVRIGTSKRYDPRELDRYITANTVRANPDPHALPSPDVGT
jgi:hypothetical protein